jgi:hypothetical protein
MRPEGRGHPRAAGRAREAPHHPTHDARRPRTRPVRGRVVLLVRGGGQRLRLSTIVGCPALLAALPTHVR